MSEPNHHTTKCFSENILAIETKKIIVKINKLLYLGLSILELSSISFGMIILNQRIDWHSTDCFINYIKTEDVYKDMILIKANDLEIKDLIHQIIDSIDHCLQKKTKK